MISQGACAVDRQCQPFLWTAGASRHRLHRCGGGFTALLGLNGAGKRCSPWITRLWNSSRRINIFGHDIRVAPGEALRLLGVVFQPRTLDLDLSVMKTCSIRAARYRKGRSARRAAMSARAARSCRPRSVGARPHQAKMRRLEIARALLHRPRLLR
jgi:ABC-2 type transport system ATP-binding protein